MYAAIHDVICENFDRDMGLNETTDERNRIKNQQYNTQMDIS